MLRYVFFIFMIALGALLGSFYTQQINPIEIVDAPPDTLRVDYKSDYVLMVAEVFAAEKDPASAARRLAQLGSEEPVVIVNQAIVFGLDNGYSPNDLIVLRDLSEAMSTWNPDLEGSGQ